MPVYQLSYLCGSGVSEVIVADGPDEAEDMARRRLLFSEPGFAIAILFEGVELVRVVQRPGGLRQRFSSPDPASPRGPNPRPDSGAGRHHQELSP